MVYLYAGLGVLMLSGIMAIFEMGLSLYWAVDDAYACRYLFAGF